MRFLLVAFLLFFSYVSSAEAYRAVAACPSSTAIWSSGATGVDPVIDVNGNICTSDASFPTGTTAVTISATGTTLATVATIPAVASVTNYICGFSIRSNATAAATGTATLAGVIVATMSYAHWTAPLASGIGITEQQFNPCIPASAANTAIVITSPAPGAGGTVSVTAWGYKK